MVVTERRKTVTAVFCDLTGSTSLGESTDPEAVRELLTRYFDRMKAIVERHGGTVEKFIGDAVMAVFGMPVAHEDDALRAVRAAEEMRDALPGIGVKARIGVNTGEVVTGSEDRPMTGDAINIAARLEQTAAPGEVLIGRPTLELVDAAVEAEPLEPLLVKGKAEPVPAFRLVHVREAPERRHELPFVGRERELGELRTASARASRDRRCELVTVVGEAGVGKSRLVRELLLLDEEARVVRGRCLPYGEGITYWPVVDVLKQVDVMPSDEAAVTAIRSLLGMSDETVSADDIAWAVRKTFEEAAADRLFVVVFDDIQWAEATFLDLIDHVALLSSDAPILLLCMARPELLDRRPTWPVSLRLEPLADVLVERLVGERVSPVAREQILRAAGGNPLFVDEMLAMASDTDGEPVVPPTLHALLTSRLDQLDHADRGILEVAAVEGEIFHRGAVQNLMTDGGEVMPRLASLVRAGLLGPHEPRIAGEDAFRFRHLLIRDAAYGAMSKVARGDLHRRFASWLEQRAPDLAELDELVGYHLEQAYTYREELGLSEDDLGAAASHRLTSAGLKAAGRQDYAGAVSLLERAAPLGSSGEVDLSLEIELVEALFWSGRGQDAFRRADAFASRAAAAGDQVGELCGRVTAERMRLGLDPGTRTERLAALVEQALPVFDRAGDHLALYIAYSALTELEFQRAKMDASLESAERASVHARQAGHAAPGSFGTVAAGRFFGTTPVPELMVWLDEHEHDRGRDHFFRAYRAWSLAKLGRFEEARAILAEARRELEDRGSTVLLANITAFESVGVELLAGDPTAAVEFGADGFRLHEELGDQTFLPGAAAGLANALYALDRLDEADAWARRALELGARDDAWNEMLWRQVRAKVQARRGEHARAERLAREAVAIADETEMLDAQGDAYADLGEVLALGGRPQDAAGALQQALVRYERKGNVVMAERTRHLLSALRDAAAT